MHPFGGIPVCPRCDKAVYAAEQAMGPGRRLYHKPCLACTICNKRLDSLTLLEHDQQPYCKSCHVKNFGTRDLRQANLPHREGSSPTPSPLPASPIRHNTFSVPPVPSQHYRVSSPPPLRFSSSADSKYVPNVSLSASVLPPNRMPSPIITSNLRYDTPPVESHEAAWEMSKSMDQVTTQSRSSPLGPSYTGQRPTPETGQVNDRPLHKPSNSLSATPMKFFPATLGRSISPATSTPNASYSPLAPTATGTRYGVALNTTGTTAGGSSARKWGGGTPTCPKCGNSVFFAEQVKAAGRTWHKHCLRCTECDTTLDSTRLTENDGQPLCRRCYSKLHGPQGSGYALLGKTGG